MKKPIKATLLPKHNATLYRFDDNTEDEYYVRGAIVWPSYTTYREPIDGVGLIAAQNLSSGQVYIYEEFPFFRLASEIEGNTFFGGLYSFLTLADTKYLCRKFFWSGDREQHKRYRKRIRKNGLMPQNLVFIEAAYSNDAAEANKLIFEYQDKIKVAEGSRLLEQIEYDSPEARNQNYLQALRTLLAGLERSPWRMPVE